MYVKGSVSIFKLHDDTLLDVDYGNKCMILNDIWLCFDLLETISWE